jgi:hypothetical protein
MRPGLHLLTSAYAEAWFVPLPRRTAEAREYRHLMAELRQLGLQPRVVLVSGTESPTG